MYEFMHTCMNYIVRNNHKMNLFKGRKEGRKEKKKGNDYILAVTYYIFRDKP